MEDFIGYVYLYIDGTNDFEYVGQTTKTVEKRFKQHAKANTRIGYAIRAHGEDMFVIVILKVCHSKAELDYWERRFIKLRNTKHPNGYNMTDGGEGTLGHKHLPETLKKMSKRGEKHPNYGKHRTPETCKKISEALTGKIRSDEHCKHISEAKKGQIPSDETRNLMSESRRGEKNHNYGKPRDPETCAKIGAAQRAYSPYKNLLAELDARNMSYTALAILLGLHSSTVTEKMRGKKNFTECDKAKLVEIFGKPIEYLLEYYEAEPDEDVTAPKRKSPYKNLLAELDARNISYADLARLMGLEKNSLARKIRGVRSFTQSDKAKLVEIFGKPIDYLLERAD